MGNEQLKKETFTIVDLLGLALDQSALNEKRYPDNELIELSHQGHIKGTFWQVEIKDYLKEYPHLLEEEIRVKPVGSEKWIPVVEFPLFQRRKLQAIPEVVGELPKELYLLTNGQKIGPITEQEIIVKLEAFEIFHSDYISIDEGNTFQKIFEIPQFERRAHIEKSHLPEALSDSIMSIHEDRVLKRKESDLDALAGLAFIEKVNSGKIKPLFAEMEEIIAGAKAPEQTTNKRSEPKVIKEAVVQEKKSFNFNKKYIYGTLIFIALSTIIYTFTAKQSDNKNANSNETKRIFSDNNPANILTGQKFDPANRNRNPSNQRPVSRTLNRKRSDLSRDNELRDSLRNQRQEKSFRDSNSYKNMSDDPRSFDNGEDPVEQDAVRSKLDKDTIDPIEEFSPGEEQISPLIDSNHGQDGGNESPQSEENLFNGGVTY